jgi:hypothetical protein
MRPSRHRHFAVKVPNSPAIGVGSGCGDGVCDGGVCGKGFPAEVIGASLPESHAARKANASGMSPTRHVGSFHVAQIFEPILSGWRFEITMFPLAWNPKVQISIQREPTSD